MEGLKIIILNGSPKGMMSVTMQYMGYLEKRFPQHSYTYINAAQSCAKFERNKEAFEDITAKIKESDLVLWAYPLYYMLVCSQYKRFIELIFERGEEDVFTGKHAAALSTSIHFFDNTAMNYIHAICEDLGMNFIDGITAKMDDLLNKEFRASFDRIFSGWEQAAGNGVLSSRAYASVEYKHFSFKPNTTAEPAAPDASARVCIVGDLEGDDSNVRVMAEYAAAMMPGSELIDLGRLKFGPCIGCLKCGFDNVCAYDGKDEFIDLHRNKILKSDIIIFAGAIHDRYLSSVWQRYLERTFNYTHQPRLTGKQIGFIISGPLAHNHNTREILQAYTEVMGGNLLGFITDESADNNRISEDVAAFVRKAYDWSASGIKLPKSFLGEGGMKVFRDDIYSHLRFVFQADHKFYRRNGLYDFPQKKIRLRFITAAAMVLTKIPPMRKIIRDQLRQGMIRPYKKLFRKLDAV